MQKGERTADDFCSMASPTDGDQDLLLDPPKGVLASPHEDLLVEFTLGRTQLKSST